MDSRAPASTLLDYATPRAKARVGLSDYHFAVMFAVAALAAAVLAAASGAGLLARAEAIKSRGDREQGRADAYRMFVISAVMIVPSAWYGYVGIRGVRRGG